MKTLKQLASDHPIQFGLLIIGMVWLIYILSGIFAAVVSGDGAGGNVINALGLLAGSAFFLYMLWSFGWLGAAGITRLGTAEVWLIALLIMVYEIASHLYGFFGDLRFGISDPLLTGSTILYNMTTGVVEEFAFRGLVLYALVRLWGDTTRGILKSALVSALIFGGSHLIHIVLGKPGHLAAFQALSAFLGGILYAAIVLKWSSIWPVVLLHGAINAAAMVKVIEMTHFEETVAGWLMILALQLPLVVLGYFWLRGVPLKKVVPEAP